VKIAAKGFTGDLHSYRITAIAEEISADVTLTSELQPEGRARRPDRAAIA
jgi:hypothetical protein